MFAGNDGAFYPNTVVVGIVIAQNNYFFTKEARSVGRIVSHFHFTCSIRSERFFRKFKLYTTTAACYSIDRNNFLTEIR